MTLKSATAILAFGLVFSLPAIAQSGQVGSGQSPEIRGEHEAVKMVPAQVALTQTLDAQKLQPGATFQAKLVGKIHLSNGTTLPSGTILAGQVVEDDMNVNGVSKLALRFATADVKNGQAIPIRATIVNAQAPDQSTTAGYSLQPTDQMPNNWTAETLKVDQVDVVSGVDLHSAIASQNSGVFVTTKKKDVQLKAGMQFALALAPATQAAPAQSGQ